MSRPVGPLASVGREGINIAGPVSTLAGSTTARWRTLPGLPGSRDERGAGRKPKERHQPLNEGIGLATLAGPWGLSLAYPVRLRLSHRPPGLPSAPNELMPRSVRSGASLALARRGEAIKPAMRER